MVWPRLSFPICLNVFWPSHLQHGYHNLVVCDPRGYVRWLLPSLRGRDSERTCFVNSPLYLRRGEFFTPGEYLLADCLYQGDG